jgi:hypothetical protein
VSYELDAVNFVRRWGVAFGRGFDAVPSNPTSPGQVTRPLDRTAARIDRELRTLQRMKAPPELLADHKTQIALFRFVSAQVRELSSAVKARNLQRIEAWDKNFARGTRRYDTRVSVRRLVTKSSYAKSVRKLRATERRLLRAYEGL